MLAALAAVTERIGLTGTINTTFNGPFEVARQFASLDHLSGGRAGWNIVTSSDAFTGANFRRGGFLDYAERYGRAEEFLTVARAFWDSWTPDAVVADVDTGIYVDPGRIKTVEHHGPHFDVRGMATPCHPDRRGIRCCCRPATLTKAVRSALVTPTRCSRCTRRWRPGSATTPTSRAEPHHTVETLTSSRSFPLPRSCSATPPRRLPIRRDTSVISKSAARPRSPCSSRCGAATCPATTPTVRCPTSSRAVTPASPRAGSATATPSRWPGITVTSLQRSTCRSASWSSPSPAATSSSAPRRGRRGGPGPG